MAKKLANVMFRVDDELYTQFKAYLTLERTTVTAYLVKTIKEYVEEKNNMLEALQNKKIN